MLDGILRAVGRIEKIASTIAAVFMFAIMMIVFSDVIMRYVFNRPFSWAYDLISIYLMAGVFFLVLSEAYTSRAHVSVDILQQKFPPAMIRLSEIVTCIVGIVVFSLIAYLGFAVPFLMAVIAHATSAATPLGIAAVVTAVLALRLLPVARSRRL